LSPIMAMAVKIDTTHDQGGEVSRGTLNLALDVRATPATPAGDDLPAADQPRRVLRPSNGQDKSERSGKVLAHGALVVVSGRCGEGGKVPTRLQLSGCSHRDWRGNPRRRASRHPTFHPEREFRTKRYRTPPAATHCQLQPRLAMAQRWPSN